MFDNKKSFPIDNFDENDMMTKKIAIYYKEIPWGIANATIYFENIVFPPKKGLNQRYIRIVSEYAGKKYTLRSVKGQLEGALMAMKNLIESKLL